MKKGMSLAKRTKRTKGGKRAKKEGDACLRRSTKAKVALLNGKQEWEWGLSHTKAQRHKGE